jgi:hypothetical protein
MISTIDKALDKLDAEKMLVNSRILTHEYLEGILEIPEATTIEDDRENRIMLLERFTALRDYLLTERKIALKSIPGVGYQVIPPNEQAEYAAELSSKLIKKAIQKGESLMINTRTEELINSDKKRHIDAQIKMQGLNSILTKERRNMLSIVR